MNINIEGAKVAGKLYHSICNFVDSVKDCGESFGSTNAYLLTKDKKCYNLIPSDRSQNIYSLFSDDDKNSEPTDGFIIKSKKSDFSVEMTCDPTLENPSFEYTDNQLIIKSNDSCGTVDIVSQFIGTNPVMFCMIFILLGLILLFIGGNKWEVILTVLGFFVAVSAVLMFFYVLVDFKYNATSFAVIIILSISIGGIVAYLTYNSVFISYIMIGFPSGYLISKIILIAMKTTLPEVY